MCIFDFCVFRALLFQPFTITFYILLSRGMLSSTPSNDPPTSLNEKCVLGSAALHHSVSCCLVICAGELGRAVRAVARYLVPRLLSYTGKCVAEPASCYLVA